MANSTVDMMPGGLESDEDSSPFETSVIITSVLNALLIPICITGNVLVLAAVWRNPSLRTPSTVLLCSLAVSDLFVGFLALPVNIAIALTPLPRVSSYSLLSQARFFLIIQLCGVSLETMTAISVDRYLALRYHMRYPNLMTSKRAMYVAATFWCKNVILSLLSIWNKNTILLVAIVFVALCFFISSITYNAIYQIVRHHQHQIHAQQQAVQSINAEQNLQIQAKRHAVNTFIYYICMVLCYFPVAVSSLIWVTYKDHRNIRWRHFADTILFMNSAINPFLYFWRNWEVRKAVLKIVRKRLCKTDEEN